jgi:hypothetical protein
MTSTINLSHLAVAVCVYVCVWKATSEYPEALLAFKAQFCGFVKPRGTYCGSNVKVKCRSPSGSFFVHPGGPGALFLSRLYRVSAPSALIVYVTG